MPTCSPKTLDLEAMAVPIERLQVDVEAGTVSGLAVLWGSRNLNGIVFEQGAFADWLALGNPVAFLWQHDPDTPIGALVEVTETDEGLAFTARLNLEDPLVTTRVRPLLRQQGMNGQAALSGISIGWLPLDQDRRGDTRYVRQAELWEVSIVTFPAERRARVRSVASTNDPDRAERPEEGDDMSQDVAPGTAPESTQAAQKGVIEQLATETYSALRPLLERAAAEQTKGGEAAAETRQAIDRVQDRLDKLETEYARAQVHAPAAAKGNSPERSEAFAEWLRTGVVPPETASMIVADPQSGGFLAPNEFVAEVIKGIVEFSPLRSVARVRQTDARAVTMPKRTQVAAAVWMSEQGSRTETQNPAYGQEEIPTHELHARADISLQDLEDTVVDLDAEIIAEFSEQFGVAEGEAFIAGNGVTRPAGILVHPDVETINSGAAAAVTGDGIIKLYFALKDAYARNATWVMRRSTIRDVRLLKDGQGNYLWQPGIAGVGPATILDRPYIEAADMPAVAASAKAIAVGDFMRGYVILDRLAMQVQRDPYTNKGFMVFTGRRRVGGQVILAEAIKTQTIAA